MASRKQEAINKNCKDCCYDELDVGTWREQVERNTCGACPLYEFRPKTIETERRERKVRVAIRVENQLETPRLH